MRNANPNPRTKTNTNANTNADLDLEAHDDAPRGAPPKKSSDTVLLGLAGGGLMAMAAAFLWRDLNLSPAHLVTVGATAGVATSMALDRRRTSGIGILALFAATLIGGVWYALHREPRVLPALGVAFVGALLNALLAYPRARRAIDRLRVGQIFALLSVSTLVATTAGYFHIFTLGVESLGRRLVLTLAWSLLGVLLVVLGGKLKERAMRLSGYAFLAAAVAKVLVYDTTHLSGSLRIGALALSGAMLLIGSLLNRRHAPQV